MFFRFDLLVDLEPFVENFEAIFRVMSSASGG